MTRTISYLPTRRPTNETSLVGAEEVRASAADMQSGKRGSGWINANERPKDWTNRRARPPHGRASRKKLRPLVASLPRPAKRRVVSARSGIVWLPRQNRQVCGWSLAEFCVELACSIEARDVRISADGVIVDEDLRHGVLAGSGHEPTSQVGSAINVDLVEFDAFARQQRFRLSAVGAPRRRVDGNGSRHGHRCFSRAGARRARGSGDVMVKRRIQG